ncbi:unnamed protein product [Arabidopsis lyrata]|nr:unnamed protein product [Arabidopsis lyrata]
MGSKDVGMQSSIAGTKNATIKLLVQGTAAPKRVVKTSVSTSTFARGKISKFAKNSRKMHFRDLESQWTRNCRYSCVSLLYSLDRPQNLIGLVHFSQIEKNIKDISSLAIALMLEKVRP